MNKKMKRTLEEKQAIIIERLLKNEENETLKNEGVALEKALMKLDSLKSESSDRKVKTLEDLIERTLEHEQLELKELLLEDENFTLTIKDNSDNEDYQVIVYFSERVENLVISEWLNGKLVFASNTK